jgi:hypothetical protein
MPPWRKGHLLWPKLPYLHQPTPPSLNSMAPMSPIGPMSFSASRRTSVSQSPFRLS